MAILFALTLFVSAALLFAVQPMTGRMLLPMLGGSPAVWNTCMVFFQAVLLLGYLYAHISTTRLGVRRQAWVHLFVLALPLLALPIAIDRGRAPSTEAPALWLLGTLTIAAGLPFFALSTTAPVLQRWFAVGRRDPYFLYAASNAGSLLALLAYPFVLEPLIGLEEQSNAWRWGYACSIVLCGLCALTLQSRPTKHERNDPKEPGMPASARWRWLVLAFIPSSLLLGVTSFITTDIAPIPLLWVVPLVLYLFTFIVAFSARIQLPLGVLGRATAIGVLCLTLVLLVGAADPIAIVLPLHLLAFFFAALLCHGCLAKSRPEAGRLTEFYLWLSLGGVLGGLFNAIAAPILFHKIGNVEYPLILLAATLVRPSDRCAFRKWDLLGPAFVGIAATLLLVIVQQSNRVQGWFKELAESTGLAEGTLRVAALFGVPLLACYTFIDRPRRFALGLGLLLLVGSFDSGQYGETVYLERNFLGLVKVTRSPDGQFYRMVHGNTVHGQQRMGSPEPLTYYHRAGPAGKVFRDLVDPWKGDRRIGAVGLGTGSLAWYAKPTQDWVFFELDPAVERVARDERYFTYLRDCAARSLRIVIGDARVQLGREPDRSFDVLVLDAFSSDAIPMHLLTAEALELYDRKLRPGGLLLFHISNRYLDLGPVLAKLGETAAIPWQVRYADDTGVSDDEKAAGKFPSQWLLMARHDDDLRPIAKSITWQSIRSKRDTPRWTDDRANVLSAWKVQVED